MPPNHSALSELADSIAQNAKLLDEHITSNNLPQPGFGCDAPIGFEWLKQPDVAQARAKLANDARKLYLLMIGHEDSFKMNTVMELHYVEALHVLIRFQVPENVPLDGKISLKDLASKTGLDVDMLTRIVRIAAVNYVFVESPPEMISHTAKSKLLATDDGTKALIDFSASEAFPTVSKTADALKQDPEGKLAPFKLAFGDTFFGHKQKNPQSNKTFARVMAGTKGHNRGQETADAFDWSSFDGTVVDIGGGLGHVSISIAETTKNLKFIVEDLPELTEQANAHIASSNMSSQVSFLGHDFFKPQPEAVRHATVYFLSNVLHDWPTDKCQLIMKNIVDVMRPGNSIILLEQVLPKPGQLLEFQEAAIRAQDLGMFGFLTARERSVADFETLMKTVDPRLKLFSVIGPPKMKRNSLIEFRLEAAT